MSRFVKTLTVFFQIRRSFSQFLGLSLLVQHVVVVASALCRCCFGTLSLSLRHVVVVASALCRCRFGTLLLSLQHFVVVASARCRCCFGTLSLSLRHFVVVASALIYPIFFLQRLVVVVIILSWLSSLMLCSPFSLSLPLFSLLSILSRFFPFSFFSAGIT